MAGLEDLIEKTDQPKTTPEKGNEKPDGALSKIISDVRNAIGSAFGVGSNILSAGYNAAKKLLFGAPEDKTDEAESASSKETEEKSSKENSSENKEGEETTKDVNEEDNEPAEGDKPEKATEPDELLELPSLKFEDYERMETTPEGKIAGIICEDGPKFSVSKSDKPKFKIKDDGSAEIKIKDKKETRYLNTLLSSGESGNYKAYFGKTKTDKVRVIELEDLKLFKKASKAANDNASEKKSKESKKQNQEAA